jgi:hypothetical protein
MIRHMPEQGLRRANFPIMMEIGGNCKERFLFTFDSRIEQSKKC